MSYQLLEQYSSTFTGPPLDPQGFAIHWWGDPAERPTFGGTIDVLLARGNQQSASVHFVAEAGVVACLVSPDSVAWGQGDGGTGWGNLNLVSIECNPRCTAGDRETVAELMADQHILNGVPLKAYPHHNFTSTQCPGVWEQHIPWLITRAEQIVAAKQNKATIETLEGIVATLNDAEKKELMTAVRAVNRYLDAPVSRVDEAVLDAPITRAVLGGDTSLRSVVAHYDNNRSADVKAGK